MPTLWKGRISFKTQYKNNRKTKEIHLCKAEKTSNIFKTVSLCGYPQKKISSGTDNLSVSILAKQVTHISLRSQTKGLTWGPCPRQSSMCVSGADNPHQHRASSLLVFTWATAEPNISNNPSQEYPTPKLNWLPQALKTSSTSYWMSRRSAVP